MSDALRATCVLLVLHIYIFACSAHTRTHTRMHTYTHAQQRYLSLSSPPPTPSLRTLGSSTAVGLSSRASADLSEHARRQGHYRSSDFRGGDDGRPRSTSCSRRDRCRERGHRCRDRLQVRDIVRSWRRAGGAPAARSRGRCGTTPAAGAAAATTLRCRRRCGCRSSRRHSDGACSSPLPVLHHRRPEQE